LDTGKNKVLEGSGRDQGGREKKNYFPSQGTREPTTFEVVRGRWEDVGERRKCYAKRGVKNIEDAPPSKI